MVCHGGFSLSEEVRRSWYNPEEILKSIGLGEGMVFVDVGCGDGFFSFIAAENVGETGRVYAVDTDAEAIKRLRTEASTRGLSNIEAKIGAAEEIVFCESCADFVFYSMVLHDFDDPVRVLRNAKCMLKQIGIMVNLDWKKLQMPFGPPANIRFSESQASELARQAGFIIETVRDIGPYHYMLIGKQVT